MKKWHKIFIVVAFVAIFFGPSFLGYVKNSRNLYIYNDDAVQYIPPFFHAEKNNNISQDYADKYYFDTIYPEGYKILFNFFSNFFSPRLLSKFLPYFTLCILLVSAGAITWKFGDAVAGFLTLSLILSGKVFLDRMGGGLPRAFGFPLLAMALAAGIYGNIYLLAAVVVLGAMFYPVAGIISGIYLSALLLLPSNHTGLVKNWSLRKKLLLIISVAFVSAILIFPQMMRGNDYGGRIPLNNLIDFPEADAGGRYASGESLKNTYFLGDFIESIRGGLFGGGEHFIPGIKMISVDIAVSFVFSIVVLLILFAVKYFIKSWKEKNYQAVSYSIFFSSVIFCYIAAIVLTPYLYFPQRYLVYSLPLFYVTIIPILLTVKNKYFVNKKINQSAVAVVVVGIFIVLFGGKINSVAGYTVDVSYHKPLYDFVGTSPEDSSLAGWPQNIYVNGLDYVAKRNIFLTYELHQALHVDYVRNMRERTHALVGAYLATDVEPLIKLREKFDVDYLVVDINDFSGGPVYFKPFDKYISEIQKKVKDNNLSYILPALKDKAIFYDNEMYIIDLHTIK